MQGGCIISYMTASPLIIHSTTPAPSEGIRRAMSIHQWMRRLIDQASTLQLCPQIRHGVFDEHYAELALLALACTDQKIEAFVSPKLIVRLLEHHKRAAAWHGTSLPLAPDDPLLAGIFGNPDMASEQVSAINAALDVLDKHMEQAGVLYQPLMYRLIHHINRLDQPTVDYLWRACGFGKDIHFVEVERYPLPLLGPIAEIVDKAGAQTTWEYDPAGSPLGYLTLMDSPAEGVVHIESTLRPTGRLIAHQADLEENSLQKFVEFVETKGFILKRDYQTQAQIHYVYECDYYDAVKRAREILQEGSRKVCVLVPYYDAVTESLLSEGERDVATNPPHRSLWSSPLIRALYVLAHPSPIHIPMRHVDNSAYQHWHKIYAQALHWAAPQEMSIGEVSAIARAVVTYTQPPPGALSERAVELAKSLISYKTSEHQSLYDRFAEFLFRVSDPHGLRFTNHEHYRVQSFAFLNLIRDAEAMFRFIGLDVPPYAFQRAFWELLSGERMSRALIGGPLQPLFQSIASPMFTVYQFISVTEPFDDVIVLGADHDSLLRDPRGATRNVEDYLHLLHAIGKQAKRIWLIGSDYDVRGVRARNDFLRAMLSARSQRYYATP